MAAEARAQPGCWGSSMALGKLLKLFKSVSFVCQLEIKGFLWRLDESMPGP